MSEPANPLVQPRTRTGALFFLLPLIASQAYTIWLVAAAEISYFQVMVLNLAEVWLATLSSMIFFSPTMDVLKRRAVKQFGITGAVFFLLVVLALAGVSGAVSPGTREQPLFRMLDLVSASLNGGLLINGVIYIGISLGMSLILAFASGKGGRAWYANVITPAYMTMLAIFLSVILFFITGMHDSRTPGLSSALFLVGIFFALRLLFAWLGQRMSKTDVEADYAKFMQGQD
jgi:hypothetical protein